MEISFLPPTFSVLVPPIAYALPTTYAVDLLRTPDGTWRALADRTQAPTGAGYALENRIVVSRALPDLFRGCNVERLAQFFRRSQQVLAALAGAPGKAIGGPVVSGRPYLVGERGPELFVPTASGRIETMRGNAGGREVRVSITVNAPAGAEPRALKASSRQVARAVKQALMRVED